MRLIYSMILIALFGGLSSAYISLYPPTLRYEYPTLQSFNPMPFSPMPFSPMPFNPMTYGYSQLQTPGPAITISIQLSPQQTPYQSFPLIPSQPPQENIFYQPLPYFRQPQPWLQDKGFFAFNQPASTSLYLNSPKSSKDDCNTSQREQFEDQSQRQNSIEVKSKENNSQEDNSQEEQLQQLTEDFEQALREIDLTDDIMYASKDDKSEDDNSQKLTSSEEQSQFQPTISRPSENNYFSYSLDGEQFQPKQEEISPDLQGHNSQEDLSQYQSEEEPFLRSPNSQDDHLQSEVYQTPDSISWTDQERRFPSIEDIYALISYVGRGQLHLHQNRDRSPTFNQQDEEFQPQLEEQLNKSQEDISPDLQEHNSHDDPSEYQSNEDPFLESIYFQDENSQEEQLQDNPEEQYGGESQLGSSNEDKSQQYDLSWNKLQDDNSQEEQLQANPEEQFGFESQLGSSHEDQSQDYGFPSIPLYHMWHN